MRLGGPPMLLRLLTLILLFFSFARPSPSVAVRAGITDPHQAAQQPPGHGQDQLLIPNGTSVNDVTNVIILYEENWSFDGRYGLWPGVNGLNNPSGFQQLTRDLKAFKNVRVEYPCSDGRPTIDPVRPFDLASAIPPTDRTESPIHEFYREQDEIDGGLMDRYLLWNTPEKNCDGDVAGFGDKGLENVGGVAISYYDETKLPVGQLALSCGCYTLFDNYYHAAFGGSWLNHMWLVCACASVWPNAAPDQIADPTFSNGHLVDLGDQAHSCSMHCEPPVTPDGFMVNQPPPPCPFPVGSPQAASCRENPPLQTLPVLGDRLNDKGLSWTWYGEYGQMVPGNFANYAGISQGASIHGKLDRENCPQFFTNRDACTAANVFPDFMQDLQNHSLPTVSYLWGIDDDNEHPEQDLLPADRWYAELISAVMNSDYWKHTVILVTFDENGGRWDHVPPPRVDRWGPGTRTPLIVFSPFARPGAIDHTQYDTTAIDKFIETRFCLPPLGSRDAASGNLLDAFTFSDTTPACGTPSGVVSLTSSQNPTDQGQSVAFTATVGCSNVTPSGTVTFTVDGTAGTPVTLSSGTATFTTSTLTTGSHSVTAAYSGDANCGSATSSMLTQVVNAATVTEQPVGYGYCYPAANAPPPGAPCTPYTGSGAYQTPALLGLQYCEVLWQTAAQQQACIAQMVGNVGGFICFIGCAAAPKASTSPGPLPGTYCTMPDGVKQWVPQGAPRPAGCA
jgi:phospholipase C